MSASDKMTLLFACLFAISEVLAGVPAIKANSLFGLIFNVLAALAGKKTS